jgi:hypothetical protein
MKTGMTLLTSGGLVALGTVLGSLLAVLIGVVRDKTRYTHEQVMAREARQQDRLERTYTELGIYLSRRADWARSVHPFLGPVPTPDPMTPGERWRIETIVTNHGSPEVRRLLGQWGEIARKIENADTVITLAEGSRSVDPELDKEALRERHALEDYRKTLDEAAADIRDRMHAELAGQAAQGRT